MATRVTNLANSGVRSVNGYFRNSSLLISSPDLATHVASRCALPSWMMISRRRVVGPRADCFQASQITSASETMFRWPLSLVYGLLRDFPSIDGASGFIMVTLITTTISRTSSSRISSRASHRCTSVYDFSSG